MNGDRVLVVGGAGFIGSHVVDALVETGARVRVLDRLHPLAHGEPPRYLNREAEYAWADVRDRDAVMRALDGVDAVSHQAAMVGLGVDIADLPAYESDNGLGTAVLLEAMHASGFCGRLVLAGSMVVYGEGRYRCPRDGVVAPAPRDPELLAAGEFEPRCPNCGAEVAAEPVTESAPADPRNVYAATKLHQEHLCSAWARETAGACIALRYHNVYGPRMPRDTPYAGVASIFRSAIEAGRAPAVFEDGAQLRDFVSVHDVAEANLLALTAPEGVDGAFNVASGTPSTVGALARGLAALTDGPEPEITGEFRLGDVRHVFASIDRARAELGYAPAVGLDHGLREFATARLRDAASVSV